MSRGGVKEYSYSEKEQEHYQPSTINQCFNISGNDISGTLDASYYKGVGERLSTEREVVAVYPQTARTLSARADSSPCIDRGQNIVYCLQGNGIDRADTAGCNGKGWRENECYTLNTIDRPAVWDAWGHGDGNIAPTMTGDHNGHLSDYTAVCIGNGQADQTGLHDKAGALNCMHDQQAVITYGLDRAAYNQGKNSRYNFSVEQERIGAQTAKAPGAVYNKVVRRLTPLECERLQGYPDNWTDIGEWTNSKGKLHRSEQNDSARYKALGNSIALPFWQWLAERICKQYDRQSTMASLFDGIGGFPLVFSRAGATPIWASEIEEFPIAVTKIHFPESEVSNNV